MIMHATLFYHNSLLHNKMLYYEYHSYLITGSRLNNQTNHTTIVDITQVAMIYSFTAYTNQLKSMT